MKQLLQNMKSGEISIIDCPTPSRPEGFVLVQNRASMISSGTERGTVQAAKASLLGKARQRPDKVRQVLDNVRKEGILSTIKKVQDKLDEPKLLGYSTCGTVLECDPHERRFKPGDRVACGGADYACHAEVIVVPRNLVVPVPNELSDIEASSATVGSIALQGLRRARVTLGDRVLVIGLGLLGQLTWQLLEDAGCRAIGTDVSADAVKLARDLGLEHAAVRGSEDVEGLCAALTDHHGVDAVIITAATQSTDPIQLAGTVCRERGVVSIVGAVPMELPRESYYPKELDLVVSRSYGPGRYDPNYEEGGQDYPYAYARWTEGRNMHAFLESVARKRVNVADLVTHRFPFDKALDAYAIVSGTRSEPHVGIVLEYHQDTDLKTSVSLHTSPKSRKTDGEVGIAFLGAGSFARSYLLPHLANRDGTRLLSVVTSRGFTANDVAKKYGFAQASTNPDDVLSDDAVDAVFIATRHDTHADLVCRSLEAGKHVFVEKPLCITEDQLERIAQIATTSPGVLQVGYNRRFSPLAVALRNTLPPRPSPIQITYRVNAGPLPAEHWLNDPEVGGGRLIGEGCHFIDLMQFFSGEVSSSVDISSFGRDADGCTVCYLKFPSGSQGTLIYQANAPKSLAKEYLEVFGGGRGGVLQDWRSLTLYTESRPSTRKSRGQQKGYAEEIDAFFSALASGVPAIPFSSLYATSLATFGRPAPPCP